VAGLALDTWAFVETYFDGPRRADVERALEAADVLVTVREVVAETFGFIVRRTARTQPAWEWWEALSASPVHVREPPLAEVRRFMASRNRAGSLSLADHALAHTALHEHARDVATGDAEFRAFGLIPLFAKR